MFKVLFDCPRPGVADGHMCPGMSLQNLPAWETSALWFHVEHVNTQCGKWEDSADETDKGDLGQRSDVS